MSQNNEPDVQFAQPGGADKFKRETGRSVGRRLAIILDGLASAPTIQSQIGAEGDHGRLPPRRRTSWPRSCARRRAACP